MAEKIEILLNNKSLTKRLGELGREFVNQKYNFEEYIERLTNHLESLCKQKCTEQLAV